MLKTYKNVDSILVAKDWLLRIFTVVTNQGYTNTANLVTFIVTEF